MKKILKEIWIEIVSVNTLVILFGTALLAFGMYNVHSLSGVTEGGILGLNLLLEQWFHISPSITSVICNVFCYAMGWKMLGKNFLIRSFVATAGFSGAYRICECFEPIYPQIAEMPLAAAIIGALFVGVSVGICVRAGAAPTGDDALAMSISSKFPVKLQTVYLTSDLIVLALSLTYIPLSRILYSLLTVIISGQIIGFMQKGGEKAV